MFKNVFEPKEKEQAIYSQMTLESADNKITYDPHRMQHLERSLELLYRSTELRLIY